MGERKVVRGYLEEFDKCYYNIVYFTALELLGHCWSCENEKLFHRLQ